MSSEKAKDKPSPGGFSGPGEKIRLGISSCLLGNSVRFDGGHKRNLLVTELMSPFIEWVSFCPEVEMGMPIPRESIRLVEKTPLKKGTAKEVRLIGNRSGTDYTAQMNRYRTGRVKELAGQKLCGLLFKKDSPSCGVYTAKLYLENGHSNGKRPGLFAEEALRRLKNLPVEEEGRLNDHRIRENFITRVFSYHRWQQVLKAGLSRKAVIDFHARHKYLLMACNQTALRRLGKLVSDPAAWPSTAAWAHEYFDRFSELIARPPTVKNHTNALQHMAGYFTRQLDQGDKEEVLKAIEDYRLERLPLIVPVTLIRHYARKFELDYLQNQVYLYPHPAELMLLNRL